MSLGIRKAWTQATAEALKELPVTTGVYEIRNDEGQVLDIAYAGTHEIFGLRSGIAKAISEIDQDGLWVRFEQHVQYQTRYVELVLNHRAQNDGADPKRVAARPIKILGRLSLG
jgi:hypothetical protein